MKKNLIFFLIVFNQNLFSQEYEYDPNFNDTLYYLSLTREEQNEKAEEGTLFFSSIPNKELVKQEFLKSPHFFKKNIVKKVYEINMRKSKKTQKDYFPRSLVVNSEQSWIITVNYQNFNWEVSTYNFSVFIFKNPKSNPDYYKKYYGYINLITDPNDINYIGHPKAYNLEKETNYDDKDRERYESYLYQRYKDGTLQSIKKFSDPDNKNSLYFKEYYSSGNISKEYDYVTQKYIQYFDTKDKIYYQGKLNSNLKKIGLWNSYFRNGNKKSIGIYDDDIPIYEWKNYHENGKLKSIGSWNNNHKIGVWNYYNENEILLKTEEWSSEEILDIKQFDLNGNIVIEKIDKDLFQKRKIELNNLFNSNLSSSKLTLITSTEWCPPCMKQLEEINANNKSNSLFEIYIVDFYGRLNKESKLKFIKKFPNLDFNFIIKNSENENKLKVVKGVPVLFFVNKTNDIIKEVNGYLNIKYIEHYIKKLL